MQTLNDARETAQRQLDAEGKKKSCKVCTLRRYKGSIHGVAVGSIHNGALCAHRQPRVYTLSMRALNP